VQRWARIGGTCHAMHPQIGVPEVGSSLADVNMRASAMLLGFGDWDPCGHRSSIFFVLHPNETLR
jgi:hypothetical protein